MSLGRDIKWQDQLDVQVLQTGYRGYSGNSENLFYLYKNPTRQKGSCILWVFVPCFKWNQLEFCLCLRSKGNSQKENAALIWVFSKRMRGGSDSIQKFLGTFCASKTLEFLVGKGPRDQIQKWLPFFFSNFWWIMTQIVQKKRSCGKVPQKFKKSWGEGGFLDLVCKYPN